MRIRLYWLIIFLLIAVGAFYFYQDKQPALSYHFAEQFDGNDYEGIYDFFNGSAEEYRVSFPFNSRIIVPWLASKVGTGDIIKDFQVVNFIFTLLAVVITFLLWRELGFDLKWIWFGFFWLIFHWTGMIRLNAFDPITVDLPLYLFQALFLLLILKRQFVWLLILGPIATIQKESFIALLLILTCYGWYHNKRNEDGFYNLKLIAGALLLSIITKLEASYFFPALEKGRGPIITILFHMRELLYHPFKLIRWVAAFFMAFGPFLVVALLTLPKNRRFDNKRVLLVLFSMVYALFGIFAGGDMTRIIFLGFPFIMSLIMFELQEISMKNFIVLSLLSVPLMMITRTIPDPAFSWDAWQSWYPEFASLKIVLIYFGYALFITLFSKFYLLKSN